MERLTIEKAGSILVKDLSGGYTSPCFGCESIGNCVSKKIQPCAIYRALEELKKYEDLDAQGRLLKLPCAKGDRVWDNDFGHPSSYEVAGFSYGEIDDEEENNKDLYQAICDLFYTYHMNRISWQACADNPAFKGYCNFIKRHGGRECGYQRQAVKLQDGMLHDIASFEILAEEFRK